MQRRQVPRVHLQRWTRWIQLKRILGVRTSIKGCNFSRTVWRQQGRGRRRGPRIWRVTAQREAKPWERRGRIFSWGLSTCRLFASDQNPSAEQAHPDKFHMLSGKTGVSRDSGLPRRLSTVLITWPSRVRLRNSRVSCLHKSDRPTQVRCRRRMQEPVPTAVCRE